MLYGIEVGRRVRAVVDRQEVAEPAAEVADVDADARHQLVLHAGRELGVPRTVAPPEARVRVERRDRRQQRRSWPGRRRTRRWPPCSRRSQSATKLPRRGSPTGRRMSFHARFACVVMPAGLPIGVDRQHVPAEVDLQRRLAVAEQVVGRPATRGVTSLKLLPVTAANVVVAGRLVERRAERLLRVAADELVVAQPQVQREPVDRPAVLDEEADLADRPSSPCRARPARTA